MPFAPALAARRSLVAALAVVWGCAEASSTAPAVRRTTLDIASRAAEPEPTFYSNTRKYADAGAKPAIGRSGSASIAMRALVDAAGVTGVEVVLGDFEGAPSVGDLDKLQVKAFLPTGEHLLTSNENRSSGGSASFAYDGLPHGGTVQVQANIGGIDPNRTDVVTVADVVRRRPDLRFLASGVPPQVEIGGTFMVSGIVYEANGEVGARTDCVLYADGVEVDRARGIWVDAGDGTTCLFAHRFSSVGMHAVEIRLEGTSPADYAPGDDRSGERAVAVVSPSTAYWSGAATSREEHWDHVVSDQWFTAADGSWERHVHTDLESGGGLQSAGAQAFVPTPAYPFPLASLEATQRTGGTTVATVASVPLSVTTWRDDDIMREECGMAWGGSVPGARNVSVLVCAQQWVAGGAALDVQLSYNAGRVTYYGSQVTRFLDRTTGLESVHTLNFDFTSPNVPMLAFGDDYSFDVHAVDWAGNEYRAGGVVPLEPFETSVERPNACYTTTTPVFTRRFCSTVSSYGRGVEGRAWSGPTELTP